MQKWSNYLQRWGQLESFHKSGHFKLLPLLIKGEDWVVGGSPLGHEPGLGATFSQFFLMWAPFLIIPCILLTNTSLYS